MVRTPLLVDDVSVIAWPPETVAPEPMYAQAPGVTSPVIIHRKPSARTPSTP